QQVADAVRAAGDQLGGVAFLHPLGQDEDARVRPLVAYQQRGPQSLVGERRGHPDVDHAHVGPCLGHRAQERLGVAGGGHHLVAGLFQEQRQALAEQDRVLGDRYAHGITAEMIVGPPGGDSTDSAPSRPAIRSARPASPDPAGSAPPMPSSLITTLSVPPGPGPPSTTTLAWVARECFAMLVSASATVKYATASTAARGRTGTSTWVVTGTGHRAARPDSAASRPRSVSTGGCTPRTSSRSSTRAALASACAWSTRAAAASTSSANFALARPSSIATATSRCWAPSCRSRSIRRRSASAASTTRSRLTSSSLTRASSWASRGWDSSRRARAASADARPRVSGGEASRITSPPTAHSATSAVPPWMRFPLNDGPPPGRPLAYSGSVRAVTPTVQAMIVSTALNRPTGPRSRAKPSSPQVARDCIIVIVGTIPHR